MSTYKLPSVTVLNGESIIQINTSDSVFGAISGSLVQIASYQAVFLVSVDTTYQQITLTDPWPYPDATAVECTIAPITSVSSLMSALAAAKALYDKINNDLSTLWVTGVALEEITITGTSLVVDHEDSGKIFKLTNAAGCKITVNPAIAIVEGVPQNAPTSHILFVNETYGYCYFVDDENDPIPNAYGNSFAAYGVGVAVISSGAGWRLFGATA